MYLFVECWKARQEWLALGHEERSAYMAHLGAGMQELLKGGAEIISWSFNDPETTYRSPYDYFAAWKFPNKDFVREFEKTVEQSGWYKYFDQVNLSGEVSDPTAPIGDMINL